MKDQETVPFYLIETALGAGFALVAGFLALVILSDRLFEVRRTRRQLSTNLRFDAADVSPRELPRTHSRRGRRALSAAR